MGIAVIVAALLLNYVINRDEVGDTGTPATTVAIAPSGTTTGTATAPAGGTAGSSGTGTAGTTNQGATTQGATTQGATSQGATTQGTTTQGQAATSNQTAAAGTSTPGTSAAGATAGTATGTTGDSTNQAATSAPMGGNSTASTAGGASASSGSSATGTGGTSAADQASTGAATTAPAPASTAAPSSSTGSSGTTASAGNTTVATTENTTQEVAAPAPAPPPVIRPSFDIVRVNPDGSTIIAGRSAPRATVTITADGQKVATVVADDRGEWVILPPNKLAPGNHQIGITSVLGAAPPVPSDDVVVVVVPQPQVASSTTGAAGGTQTAAVTPPQQPLAVVVPRTDQGSTVLQSPNPPQSGQLILESVDYDSKGRVVIGGRAAPGKEVRAYLDNGLMGMTRADSSGRWHITPDKPVLPGLHTLRIDEVDDAGKVLARVESPFSRAEPLSIGAGDQVVVVQPGNNLWLIATRTYGSGPRYTVIYQANKSQIANPDLIYPGQVFKLPTATP
jgi:nucleoid-associated protein YgaU